LIMGHCALILAGGMGSRLGYREKALIDIKGRPLIVLVIEKLKNVVDTIIVSVRDEAQGKMLESFLPGCRFAYDTYKNVGPLAGILSGLEACEDDLCFIAACDMPFINENVVTMLFEKSEHHDAAIPRWDDGFLEPLHAVYKRKPMLRETKKAVEKGVNASKVIQEVSPIIGGGGGGKPSFAQGGGTQPEKLQDAVKKAEESIKKQLQH